MGSGWCLIAPMLPVYALSSILAVLVVLAVGGAALLQDRRARRHLSLALFCGAWAVLAGAAAWLQLGDPRREEWCGRWFAGVDSSPLETMATVTLWQAHVPPAFAFVVGFFAMIHVLVLTGRDERLDERLGPIRVRDYVVLFALLTVAGALLTLGTDLVVAGVSHDPLLGYAIHPAVTAPLVQVPYGLAALVWLSLLRRATREAKRAGDRALLRQSTAGLSVLLLATAGGVVILPQLGVPSWGVPLDACCVMAPILLWSLARHREARREEAAREDACRHAAERRELARAQARLAQAEKLAALGVLVAGVANEMNAPLSAVRSMYDTRERAAERLLQRIEALLGERVGKEKTFRRSRTVLSQGDAVIRDGLERIEQIVSELRSFARLDQAGVQAIDLNAALDEALDLMSTRLPRIRVVRRYAVLPRVTCVVRQVGQLFFNVLTNAVEAIEARAGGPGASAAGVLVVATEQQGDQVGIRITDDGIGIAPDHLARVFEPGFTTKPPGGGLGLGLAICHQIVHEHGGDIGVDSAFGVGTTVRLALPIEARLIVRSGAAPVAAEPE